MITDSKAFEIESQRAAPVDTTGAVIGTAGTSPYVHLQLEQAERMFGKCGLPILVVNDGEEDDALIRLCDEYEVEYFSGPRLGHTAGDIRVFQEGVKWADSLGLTLLVKLSRRFIPLVPWRHNLSCAASMNQHCAVFGRTQYDRVDSMLRTDCIALRVKKWANCIPFKEMCEEVFKTPDVFVHVEERIRALANVLGGYDVWDFMSPDMFRPYKNALQWRGIPPSYYADLSRELGLPYDDDDFEVTVQTTGYSDSSDWRTNATAMKVL